MFIQGLSDAGRDKLVSMEDPLALNNLVSLAFRLDQWLRERCGGSPPVRGIHGEFHVATSSKFSGFLSSQCGRGAHAARTGSFHCLLSLSPKRVSSTVGLGVLSSSEPVPMPGPPRSQIPASVCFLDQSLPLIDTEVAWQVGIPVPLKSNVPVRGLNREKLAINHFTPDGSGYSCSLSLSHVSESWQTLRNPRFLPVMLSCCTKSVL